MTPDRGTALAVHAPLAARAARLAAAAGLAAALVATLPPPAATPAPDRSPRAVIVRAVSGHLDAATQAAERLGAVVGRRLGIIDGFSADLPAHRLDDLARVDAVESVAPDGRMRPASVDPVLGYDANGDTGSMSAVTRIVGAQDLWAGGYTGKGVDVALIDTGVTPVEGLGGLKVVDGPDLSFDSQDPARERLDAYGHGTHMAGIIAGRDNSASAAAIGCATCLNASGYSDTTKFVGVAPDSRIVNVKVGAYDGGADVSQVIAGIDWVVQHRRDPGLNIRVLNLSFGTDSLQPYTVDPLAHAAEVAWRNGIVVVAAAGNDGTTHAELANPAYDPFLLAVGGSDANGTLQRTDDVVPDFASRSTTNRNVDVVAPAVSVISLRVPGSYVDELPDNGGRVGTRFQRGTGTSQSAAVVSGLAALLLERFPLATPDQLKSIIRNTAYSLPAENGRARQGRGLVDGAKAMRSSDRSGSSSQSFTPSTGTGSLDAARGSALVYDGDVALTGERDIFGRSYDAAARAAARQARTAWSGGVWNGGRWTGDDWLLTRWQSGTWDGPLWSGWRWSASDSTSSWDGSRWTGSRWTGSRWTGSRWSGSRWSGSTWR